MKNAQRRPSNPLDYLNLRSVDPDRLCAYLDYVAQEAALVARILDGLDQSAFETDPVLLRAVERAIETVGEAVSKLRPVLEPDAPDLPWRQIVGMRNILAHVYWDVDTDIVWDVATVHLPVLAGRLARLRTDRFPDAPASDASDDDTAPP